MSASRLPARPLVVVTGKGGTGKTTIAAALARAYAGGGARTIIAEVGDRADVPRALGSAAPLHPGRETLLEPGLHHTTIDPEQALATYLSDQLPSPVAAIARSSRGLGLLAAATPGLRELLTIGSVWELTQKPRRVRGAEPFDIAILDAPATGHGVALLTAAATFARAARGGPIARQAGRIDATLRDPLQTAIVAVALPHEAAVTETLMLRDAVRRALERDLDRIIVNAVEPVRFTAAEVAAVHGAHAGGGAAVAWQHDHAAAQRRHVARLRRGAPGVRVQTFAPSADPELGSAEIDRLAARI